MKQLLLISLILLLPGAALSQNRKQVDQAGRTFWTQFKDSVARGDKESVVKMTRLPFLFGGQELNRAKFIQRFDSIFDARVKRCFTKATLLPEGDGFEVFCGKQIFLFERIGGVYKFTEIGAND